ncbi:MAG: hypothetical protein AAGC60_01100 [Acidobacteriota bacterium]
MESDRIATSRKCSDADFSGWLDRIVDCDAGVIAAFFGRRDVRIVPAEAEVQGVGAEDAFPTHPVDQDLPGRPDVRVQTLMANERETAGFEHTHPNVQARVVDLKRSEANLLDSVGEVHVAGRLDSSLSVRGGPKLSRGTAEVGAECPGERLVSLVPSLEGDAHDRSSRELEMARRSLEPEPADVLLDRFSDQALEDPMEVEGGEIRDRSQVGQG